MNSATKTILAIAVILIIAVGGYFIYKSYYPSSSANYQINPMPENNQQNQTTTNNNTTTQQPANNATDTKPMANGSQITIRNFAFNPTSLTVPAGTTVTWTNQDSAPHQIASDNNVFNSASLSSGQTYQYTFQTLGTYKYHCAIHTSMTGEIIVK